MPPPRHSEPVLAYWLSSSWETRDGLWTTGGGGVRWGDLHLYVRDGPSLRKHAQQAGEYEDGQPLHGLPNRLKVQRRSRDDVGGGSARQAAHTPASTAARSRFRHSMTRE